MGEKLLELHFVVRQLEEDDVGELRVDVGAPVLDIKKLLPNRMLQGTYISPEEMWRSYLEAMGREMLKALQNKGLV